VIGCFIVTGKWNGKLQHDDVLFLSFLTYLKMLRLFPYTKLIHYSYHLIKLAWHQM
jgi:hypothetical protein